MENINSNSSEEMASSSKFFNLDKFKNILNPEIDSPSLDLALNLQILSTNKSESHIYRETCYARRKLSLTLNDLTNKQLPDFKKQLSLDDGCCVDTPPCSQESSLKYKPRKSERNLSPIFSQLKTSDFRKNLSEPMVRCPTSSISLTMSTGTLTDPSLDKENLSILRSHKYANSISLDNTFKSPSTPRSKRVAFSNETNRNQGPTNSLAKRNTANYMRAISTDDGFMEQCSNDGFDSPLIRTPSNSTPNSFESLAVIPNRFDRLLFSPLIESPDRGNGVLVDSVNGSLLSENNDRNFIRPARFHAKSSLVTDNITRRLCWTDSLNESSESHIQAKRRKSADVEKIEVSRGPLFKCHSEAEISSGKGAMDWENLQQDHHLIGDFSKTYCLPLIDGKHQDLKCISIDTMADLLQNAFSDIVTKYTVIDCRYPYEYTGGHIKGAKNIYTADDIMKDFFHKDQTKSNSLSSDDDDDDVNKRNLYIFHCEFSSERGPKLSRFLRNQDRDSNADTYPNLHYPEIYLLEGGYKAFFESYPDLCEPKAYVPMLHSAHNSDLKLYRAKSSSLCVNRSRSYNSTKSFKSVFK